MFASFRRNIFIITYTPHIFLSCTDFAITIVSIIVVAVVGKAKDTRSGISKAPTSVQWANNITTTGNARVVAKAPIGPPNSYEKDVVDDDDDDTVMVESDRWFQRRFYLATLAMLPIQHKP